MGHHPDHRKMPEHLTTWGDIVQSGVIYPHPTSTISQLWEWINDHGQLIGKVREAVLNPLKDEKNPYVVRELQRLREERASHE